MLQACTLTATRLRVGGCCPRDPPLGTGVTNGQVPLLGRDMHEIMHIIYALLIMKMHGMMRV